MNEPKISKALNHMDDDLIADAVTYRPKKASCRPLTKWAAIAACFCLLVAAAISVPRLYPEKPAGNNPPGISTPSEDTVGIHTPLLSAKEIAGLFSADRNGGLTNAYTLEYAPDVNSLHTFPVPNAESAPIYSYNTAGTEPSEDTIQAFANTIFLTLAPSLHIDVPEIVFTKNDAYDGSVKYSSVIEAGGYTILTEQNNETNSAYVLGASGETDTALVFHGDIVCIDINARHDEMLEAIKPIAGKINAAFGTDFHDIKIVKHYGGSSTYSTYKMDIILYNKQDEPVRDAAYAPLSDYILIDFSDFEYNSNNGILNAQMVMYVQYRVPMQESLTEVGDEPLLTVSEAEEMLKKGYVFGGHSCRLWIQSQEKIDFSDYDYVGFEYVMGEPDSDGICLCVPFYTFFKDMGVTANGNHEYAKTYVCAVPVAGIETYFDMQSEKHDN